MNSATRVRIAYGALTFGTGAVDVASFLRLGHVFSSVMTSNLVLSGVAAALRDPTLGLHCAVALGGYLVGVALGTVLTPNLSPEADLGAPRITVVLGTELAVLVIFSVVWVINGGRPSGDGELALLAMAALTMGGQSVVASHLGSDGLSTTYLTGTLTGLVSGLVKARGLGGVDPAAGIALLTLILGAGAGAVLVEFGADAFPVLPLLAVSAVLAISLGERATRSEATGGSPRPGDSPLSH